MARFDEKDIPPVGLAFTIGIALALNKLHEHRPRLARTIALIAAGVHGYLAYHNSHVCRPTCE